MAISVVVADDHTLVRQGIRKLLELNEDIRVVGEAEDGKQAVGVIEKTRPDVAVLDVRMPTMTGIDAARTLRQRKVDVRILFVTTFDDEAIYVAAVRENAAGFLLKDCDGDELADSIRHIATGNLCFTPRLDSTDADRTALVEPLTRRERQVLLLLAGGLSNAEIAEELGTAEGTVKNQCSTIFKKLGVRQRTQAVLKAMRLGII